MNRAFTLIELLVVAGIIILLTAIVFPNYKFGQSQLALQRSGHRLAQDLRRAQEMAMSAKECPPEICGGAEPIIPNGYGIFLKTTEPKHYILFADLNNNQDYDPGFDGIVEDIEFEKGIKITNLSAASLRITFSPPAPTVTIRPTAPAIITLENSKTITVNEVGLIEIE